MSNVKLLIDQVADGQRPEEVLDSRDYSNSGKTVKEEFEQLDEAVVGTVGKWLSKIVLKAVASPKRMGRVIGFMLSEICEGDKKKAEFFQALAQQMGTESRKVMYSVMDPGDFRGREIPRRKKRGFFSKLNPFSKDDRENEIRDRR